METTIEQIANKLDPSPYLESTGQWAKEKIENFDGESLTEGAKKVGEGVKNNPLPIALAGLTLASLYYARKKATNDKEEDLNEGQAVDLEAAARERTSSGINAPAYEDPNFDKILSEVEEQHAANATSSTNDSGENSRSLTTIMNEWKAALSEKNEVASEKIAEVQDRGRTRLQRTGNVVKEKSKEWKDSSLQRFENGKNHSPALLGFGALAVGFLAALALPRTRKENDLCGEPSDKLKEKAIEKRDAFAGNLKEQMHEKGLDPEELESRACEAVDEAANSIVGKMNQEIPPSN